jgi:hypothetical protein
MRYSEENTKSIKEFVKVVCQRDKSAETLRNYLNTIGNFTHHTGIKDPLFTDINFNNMMIVKNGVIEKGGSRCSCGKSYFKEMPKGE